MAGASVPGFERGRAYTRSEVAAVLGGGMRALFPSRGGKVLAVCASAELNPRAPDELLAGPGLRHVRAARRLAESGAAVPVFVRREAGRWEYVGDRRVAAVVDDPGLVGEAAAAVARDGGAVILRLEDGSSGAPGADGSGRD